MLASPTRSPDAACAPRPCAEAIEISSSILVEDLGTFPSLAIGGATDFYGFLNR